MLEIIATLALATNCVQAPPHKPHHRPAPVALASCDAPRAIVLQPDPEPLEPIAVYVIYPMIGMCYRDDDAPPASVSYAIQAPPVPPDVVSGYSRGWMWRGPPPVAVVPHTALPPLPRTDRPRPPSAPAKAPEIDPSSAVGALTLLCGLLAVAKGRTTNSGGTES